MTDPAELIALLELGAEFIEPATRAARKFGLRVPRGFVARMRRGDANDPLLRQVLPLAAEDDGAPGFGTDPVGDLAAVRAPGLIQKYRGRVLLTATGACAVHCRYCFRRHFPYADSNPAADDWQQALSQIQADRSISEVILSGGDPLMLSDARLAAFVESLARIRHVRRLRVHTRVPIVLPERVTDELCALLAEQPLQSVVVVHANHPAEISPPVTAGLTRLRRHVSLLLNQSVLLKGVNDDARILCDLSERLFASDTLPYYLHLLDKVQGAAHFDVDEATALQIWEQMTTLLPGFLVPRLVREEPGAPAKTVIR